MAFQVPVRRGEAHPLSKLSNAERRDCRERFRRGEAKITDLAREKEITRQGMTKIVRTPDWWEEV